MGLTTVRLYGVLGRKFGREFKLAVSSPREAIGALSAVLPGFREHLVEHSAPGYHVFIDKENLGVEDLSTPCGKGTIKIVPVTSAAKDGAFQSILGVVLIVAGAMTGQSWLVSIGIAQLAGGIAQLLADNPPSPLTPTNDPGGDPSYLFNGAVNTVAQGHCVPLCYGKMRVGSAVVSLGTSDETFTRLGGSDGTGARFGNGDTIPWAWSVDPVS